MSNKGVLVLLLLLSLALSGCGKQRSNNSTLRSNEEIDFPEIYTEFNESYNGEVKKMDGFEGQTYYSYGLWGENSQYMHDTTIYLENNTLFQCTESRHRPDKFRFVDLAKRKL